MRKFINKIGAFVLLFLLIGSPIFSTAFASVGIHHNEKKVTVVSESTDSMADVLGILHHHGVNLTETSFFFDYDETIATLISEWDGHVYHALPSPDLNRTYGSTFDEAKKELNLDASSDARLLEPFFTLEPYSHYEVLDDGIIALIKQLKSAGAHVGVCSALQPNGQKLMMLESVGIDSKDYTFASGGKAKTIKQYLEHNLEDKKISSIALIDNSFKFALENYIETMGPFAQGLPQTQDVPEIKIVAIEFTKFKRRATPSSMRTELENMMGSLSKS
ncbi:MAG: haloacid dehalogenase-like hydrolase [Alphaproteobacteria bacterium]|nr:haloacid dehalogenase-like hydrolase [Alphaproteobacteria bacterium]